MTNPPIKGFPYDGSEGIEDPNEMLETETISEVNGYGALID